jgi:hypothetical protein
MARGFRSGSSRGDFGGIMYRFLKRKISKTNNVFGGENQMDDNSKHSKLEKVRHTAMDIYVHNPVIRALANLLKLGESALQIPQVMASLDEMLVVVFENAEKRRLRNLLDELCKGERYLTEELVQQEEFLYAFYAVARATALTYQKEKIQLFARLLINACRHKMLDSNEFEENLKILDELSAHEFKLLLLFREHENQLKEKVRTQPGDHSKLQWDALAAEAESHLGIPSEHLGSTLTRLARTGLYQPLFGVSFAGNDTLGSGATTPRLNEFLKWVLDENATVERPN